MIGLIGMSIAQGVENIKGYDDTDQDGPHCEGPLQDFEGAKWCNSEWNLWSILSHIDPLYSIIQWANHGYDTSFQPFDTEALCQKSAFHAESKDVL